LLCSLGYKPLFFLPRQKLGGLWSEWNYLKPDVGVLPMRKIIAAARTRLATALSAWRDEFKSNVARPEKMELATVVRRSAPRKKV